MKEGPLRSCGRNGLVAGATVALALAIIAAQNFKPGLLTPPGLALWYAASLSFGGAAGYAGGLLASRLPARAAPAASCLAGAVFGALSQWVQLYIFLLYMFRNRPGSF